MFERYTEKARRVLFFSRYEASQLGSVSIETEHVLLGLVREGKGLTSRIFARAHLSLENLRTEVEGRAVFVEKVATSVGIPFSPETKRVLDAAAEEADRLQHNCIGAEHLLLGLLNEERSVAGSLLIEKAFVWTQCARHRATARPAGRSATSAARGGTPATDGARGRRGRAAA
jgi:ATP-dependent Clp protease ATP-binding subunit ClpC